jgi:hypothetical protein
LSCVVYVVYEPEKEKCIWLNSIYNQHLSETKLYEKNWGYDLFLYAIYNLLCLRLIFCYGHLYMFVIIFGLFIGDVQFLHGSCFFVSKAMISFLSWMLSLA